MLDLICTQEFCGSENTRLLVWLLLATFLVALIPQVAMAAPVVINGDGTKSQTVQGVTVTTPMTYDYCVDAPSGDTVTISNPNGHIVVGTISVQYVTGTGHIVLQNYPVNTTSKP
jgi:hypothetical protein